MRIQSPSWAAGQGEPRTRSPWRILASPATWTKRLKWQDPIPGLHDPESVSFLASPSSCPWVLYLQLWHLVHHGLALFYLLKCCNKLSIVLTLEVFFTLPSILCPQRVPHSPPTDPSPDYNRIWNSSIKPAPGLWYCFPKGSLWS